MTTKKKELKFKTMCIRRGKPIENLTPYDWKVDFGKFRGIPVYLTHSKKIEKKKVEKLT